MSLGGPTHLLGMAGMSREDIERLLDSAESFLEVSRRDIKKVPALRGKTVVALFYEPSTRTRMSFEIAAKRMSADFVSLSAATSSAAKGESLLDTARNIAAMCPDCLILRHSAPGSARFVAGHVPCPVVNAGDGAHEHPTQALLDLLTIRLHLGRLEGLRVAIVGDILHSRVARSNAHALRAFGSEVCFVGPATLVPPEAERWGEVCHDLRDGIAGADVVMVLRIQRERQGRHFLPSIEEYARRFCLTAQALSAAPGALVLHPGPINRGVEIAGEVADGPYSVITEQVTNGVAVRMAVLYHLIARPRGAATEERGELLAAKA